MPQGSLCDSSLYTLYAGPLQDVPYSIGLHGYADDLRIKSLYPARSRHKELYACNDLSKCMSDVKSWMDSARLKLMKQKTEFIIMGSKQLMDTVDMKSIDINDFQIKRINSVKYL